MIFCLIDLVKSCLILVVHWFGGTELMNFTFGVSVLVGSLLSGLLSNALCGNDFLSIVGVVGWARVSN